MDPRHYSCSALFTREQDVDEQRHCLFNFTDLAPPPDRLMKKGEEFLNTFFSGYTQVLGAQRVYRVI